jgi:hypothetical protein
MSRIDEVEFPPSCALLHRAASDPPLRQASAIKQAKRATVTKTKTYDANPRSA